MKQKFLLAFLIVLCASTATKAQITKGSVWLGGSLGFSQKTTITDPNAETKEKNFTISPAIGKAINENTILGIQLNYTKSKTDYSGGTTDWSKASDFGAGIFLRKYALLLNRLYIFGHGFAGFDITRDRTSTINDHISEDTKGWSASLSFTPGVSFAATKKVHLETGFNSLFSLTYSKSKKTSDFSTEATKSENFSTGINLENRSGFYLGVRILLAK